MRAHLSQSLALVLAAGVVLASSPARADDDKPSEKSEKLDKAPPADDAGSAATTYPPFSTRFWVAAAGVFVAASGWAVVYGAAKGWPEYQCHITQAGSFDIHNQPCVSGPPGSNSLGIPIAGPWIALGKSGCASDEPNCSGAKVGARAFGFVIDGIVQGAGAALVIQAIVMKTELPTLGPKKVAGLGFRLGDAVVRPTPVVTPSMQGVGLSGTF